MNNNGTDEPTKDLTEDLSDRQLLLLLLERVTDVNERVARLEKAEVDRKLETRPLWARLDGQMTTVMAQLSSIEARLSAVEAEQARMRDEQRRMRTEIKLFREDLDGERRERFYMDERITELERAQQPPQ
jgi:chromosome segregation ATPase